MGLMEHDTGEEELDSADLAAVELKRKVVRTVEALEENKAAIHRWLWKALLAFNLVLWSVTVSALAILGQVQTGA